MTFKTNMVIAATGLIIFCITFIVTINQVATIVHHEDTNVVAVDQVCMDQHDGLFSMCADLHGSHIDDLRVQDQLVVHLYAAPPASCRGPAGARHHRLT